MCWECVCYIVAFAHNIQIRWTWSFMCAWVFSWWKCATISSTNATPRTETERKTRKREEIELGLCARLFVWYWGWKGGGSSDTREVHSIIVHVRSACVSHNHERESFGSHLIWFLCWFCSDLFSLARCWHTYIVLSNLYTIIIVSASLLCCTLGYTFLYILQTSQHGCFVITTTICVIGFPRF